MSLLLGVAASDARAEVRRVEIEAALPVSDGVEPTRQAVLEEALGRAVEQVAFEMAAPDSLPGGDRSRRPGGGPVIRGSIPLGAPARSFVVRYQVIEDQGVRQGSQGLERVILAEVHVDADLVAASLHASGIAIRGGRDAPSERFLVEVRELRTWHDLQRLRRELLERGGASLAVTAELTPGRALLRVEAPGGAERLLERLLADPPGDFEIEPLTFESGVLALRVRQPLANSAPFDTQH